MNSIEYLHHKKYLCNPFITIMDLLQLLSFPIIFTMFLFMLMKLTNKSKLPPGPWKLPIIGNIHQMIGALPHHTLRHLSNKHGPLMHLQLGELSIVVISSPDMAMEVYKKHDAAFTSRPHLLAADVMTYNSINIVFSPYGAYWRELRKICMSKLLSESCVKSLSYVREEETSNFIKLIGLSAGKPVNLTRKIFSLTSGIVSRAAFGKKSEEQEEFISVTSEAIELVGGFAVADLFPSIEMLQVITGMKGKLLRVHKKANKILENIINEHKMSKKLTRTNNGEPVEDLLDVLLKYTDGANTDFPLTNNNVKAVIVDMFIGGTDSSSITVDWAMTEMIKNPSVMAKAQAEVREIFDTKGKVDETEFHKLNYLKLVIKETLRLHPPGPLLVPRECGKKCEINGYEIPLKTKVIVNAWAIGRDPNYWNDPDNFNPERFEGCSTDFKGKSFEFIPFGAGRRICPGISFGLASIEHSLAQLLYHFDWKLPEGMKHGDLDMTELFGLAVKRKHDLVLVPIAYPKSSIVFPLGK